MKRFAELYAELDGTTKTTVKVAAMVRYFKSVSSADAAWAVYFLTGRKPKQVVPSKAIRQWAAEAAGLPDWLFEESYHAVGDLAETTALLLPDNRTGSELPLHHWVEERLLPMRDAPLPEKRQQLLSAWSELNAGQRFVWNKLITGAFRVGVSQSLVVRALAQVSGLDVSVVAHRLMGDWRPTPHFFEQLISQNDQGDADPSRPYPFFLASPLEAVDPASLGPPEEWHAEWKWDGIRAQLIRRNGSVFLWSRGEELVTDRYPEVTQAASQLPDGTVIDGELLPWEASGVADGVRPFGELQRRIGRKSLTKKLLREVPVVLLAYDLLEADGEDLRSLPLQQRLERLRGLVGQWKHGSIRLSEPVGPEAGWLERAELRQQSRARNVEGLMLKRKSSPYRAGRVRGDWWKWKVNPFSVDAVLVYAQRGSGKRASLYTDYTFALWSGQELVPFAKAYSGLTDEEIRQVDKFIRQHTLEKFGPVRTVQPELVFEIGFEGIQESSRHKSGVAVRFPRILRWRQDKPIGEADSLETVRQLLPKSSEPKPATTGSLFPSPQ